MYAVLLGLAKGVRMNAVWGRQWWLSLSCQWELLCVNEVWVCFVVVSYNLYPLKSMQQLSLCKSSDLVMINPHISLNPWNPPNHGAILGFHGGFLLWNPWISWAILRFSTGDLFRLNPQVDLRVRSFSLSWGSVWRLDRLPFTQSLSDTSTVYCRCNVFNLRSRTLNLTDLNMDSEAHRCIVGPESDFFLLILYSIHPAHHEILYTLGWNPQIYL